MRLEYDVVRGIVPPHILEAMAEHANPMVREAALQTIALSAQFQAERRLVGPTMAAAPVGELRRTVYDMKHMTWLLPGLRVRGEDEPPVNDTAVNEAYDDLGSTYAFFKKVLGRDSIDNHGMRLDASVHYGDHYDNAFWNGRQMVFGDGDGEVFVGFTRAIDVVAHELTHGVTQYMADLAYHDQPGALNESFSDVFGSLVKQYVNRQDAASADWLIGAGILGPAIHGKALRSMSAPGTAYNDKALGGKDPQPGHMSGYVHTTKDNGGVHLNSGIPNHAFYLVATKLGGFAWETAGAIWYETLGLLGRESQFTDCARLTIQVAGEERFGGPGGRTQQIVRTAWSEVGIEIAPPVSVVPSPVAASRLQPAPIGGGDSSALRPLLEELVQDLRRTADLLSKAIEVRS